MTTKNYKMVMCQTCHRMSLVDIDDLPKDERGRPVLTNCKREARYYGCPKCGTILTGENVAKRAAEHKC